MDKEQLYLDNEKLIQHFLYKKAKGYIPPSDMEDVKQDLRLSLWVAVMKYDPEKAKFSTWAIAVIEQAYFNYIKYKNREKRNITPLSLDKIRTDEEENPMSLADLVTSNDLSVEDQVMHRLALEKINHQITDKDRELMRLLCTYDRQVDIAHVLGGTQRMVSHRKDVLLNKIKKLLKTG